MLPLRALLLQDLPLRGGLGGQVRMNSFLEADLIPLLEGNTSLRLRIQWEGNTLNIHQTLPFLGKQKSKFVCGLDDLDQKQEECYCSRTGEAVIPMHTHKLSTPWCSE